jgi:hypothetical protein
MWPVDFFDSVGVWLERRLNRIVKASRYEYVNGHVRRMSVMQVSKGVSISEISEWSVHPEMGFDVIRIETAGAGSVQWIDVDGSLFEILRKQVPSKMRPLSHGTGGRENKGVR